MYGNSKSKDHVSTALPPRSLDMIPLDLFLYGYDKFQENIWHNPFMELCAAVVSVTADMLERTGKTI